MQEFGFNTAIASLMELVNGLYKMKVTDEFRHYQQWRTAVEQLLKLLAPFAPFISEELWHDLGHFDSIHQTTWPEWDESLLSETTTTIVVQINGKLRAEIKMPLPTNQEAITKTAMTHEKVIPYLSGKNIVKTIYVPEKIINFVLNN
jgi:leucyl-tRNA synthetase